MDPITFNYVECRTDPDGRQYWIDYRPSEPSWRDPRVDPSDPMPGDVETYVTPDGREYFVDKRPKLTWKKPDGILDVIPTIEEPSQIGGTSSRNGTGPVHDAIHSTPKSLPQRLMSRSATLVSSAGGSLGQSSSSPINGDVRLLMHLTRWRFAQVLSGFPDARVGDVDTLINVLQTRISAFPDTRDLRPLEPWFSKQALDLISSQPNLNFMPPKTSTNADQSDEQTVWGRAWTIVFMPLLFSLMLGVPTTYKRRLARTDWIQWASSKRWVDQQAAMDGFLKNLINEWNLMILLSTLILSTSVGFLSINNIPQVPQTAVLISLVFGLASIVLDVGFVWRYQRQLTNSFDMRVIMDEFIFQADEDILSIYLSLPVSFLLWSVLTFAVGVVAYAWSSLPELANPVGVTAALSLVSTLTLIMVTLHQYMYILVRDPRRPFQKGGVGRIQKEIINLDRGFLGAKRGEKSPLGDTVGTKGSEAVDLKPLDEAGTA